MDREEIYRQIQKKKSLLCVGLDSEIRKIPGHLQKSASPVLEFNKAIIDATHDLAIAYKPNLAFYEERGVKGWEDLARTVEHIRSVDPGILIIADAKRGDIGNTAAKYARTFFTQMDFDAVTLSPYMGRDSVEPFLEYKGKWVIVLGLTSNPGAQDFQLLELPGGTRMYQQVIRTAAGWAGPDQMMFVAGATRSDLVSDIRQIIPDHFLLVPGTGAQGGSMEQVIREGMNGYGGLIINASRSIIFADQSRSFTEKARSAALSLQGEMASILKV